jgi:hypothetical protein
MYQDCTGKDAKRQELMPYIWHFHVQPSPIWGMWITHKGDLPMLYRRIHYDDPDGTPLQGVAGNFLRGLSSSLGGENLNKEYYYED